MPKSRTHIEWGELSADISPSLNSVPVGGEGLDTVTPIAGDNISTAIVKLLKFLLHFSSI